MTSCSIWLLVGAFVVGVLGGANVGFVALGLLTASRFPPRDDDGDVP